MSSQDIKFKYVYSNLQNHLWHGGLNQVTRRRKLEFLPREWACWRLSLGIRIGDTMGGMEEHCFKSLRPAKNIYQVCLSNFKTHQIFSLASHCHGSCMISSWKNNGKTWSTKPLIDQYWTRFMIPYYITWPLWHLSYNNEIIIQMVAQYIQQTNAVDS